MEESFKPDNSNKIFLGEDDYTDKIQQYVRPMLLKIRKTGYFQSFDGTSIFYEAYVNPQQKKTVVISHGFCEFTYKFEEVIFYFFQAGYSVYIHDHRGHGYSQRMVEDRCKVYIRSYEEYVQDLHYFITNIVLEDKSQKQLVLYAHSMGGAIAALYLSRHPGIFSRAVLSSPMLQMNFGVVLELFVRLILLYKSLRGSEMDYVIGHGAFDGIPGFETSSCNSRARYEDIFKKRMQDEHYRTYGASYAWTHASLKALHDIRREAKLIKTPILLFQAGKDNTIKPGGQKYFAKKSHNTKMIKMPRSKHEIYNSDTDTREEYYQKIFEFFDEKSI